MNEKEIAQLADEIMDDLRAWAVDLRSDRKERDEVWAGIKKDITCSLRNVLGGMK